MFDIDELKIYRGSDIPITDKIIVIQPTIDQIIEFGEKRYFQTVHCLTGVGADFKWQLWDYFNIDYTTIDDFELFKKLIWGSLSSKKHIYKKLTENREQYAEQLKIISEEEERRRELRIFGRLRRERRRELEVEHTSRIVVGERGPREGVDDVVLVEEAERHRAGDPRQIPVVLIFEEGRLGELGDDHDDLVFALADELRHVELDRRPPLLRGPGEFVHGVWSANSRPLASG